MCVAALLCAFLPLSAGLPTQGGAASSESRPLLQWVDLDADGLQDLLVPGGAAPVRALRNRGDGGFEDVTGTLGLDALGAVRQLSVMDVDRDGDPDLLAVRREGTLVLLENERGGGFLDVTPGSGLAAVRDAVSVTWLDYDLDGAVDLVVNTALAAVLEHNRGGAVFSQAWVGHATTEETSGDLPLAISDPSIAVPQGTGAPGGSQAGDRRRSPLSTRRAVAPSVAGFSSAPGAGTRSAPASRLSIPTCARTLRDVTTGQCLSADTTPTLGRLYPLSTALNLDPTGNVGIGTTTPSAKLTVAGPVIRQVARAGGVGPIEQADSGQLTSRTLTFTKTQDATSIRVSYTDNFGITTTSPASGRWELRVDGAAPPGGAVHFDFYIQSNSSSWRAANLTAYLDGVPAGTHTIEVWVGGVPAYSRGNLITGYFNAPWVLEAEEVF